MIIHPLNDSASCLISLESSLSASSKWTDDKDSSLITATFPSSPVKTVSNVLVEPTIAARCCANELLFSPIPRRRSEKNKTRTTRRRKQVRFNESDNQSYSSRPGVFHEDCKQFWYSGQDYTNFKLSSKEAARRFVSADMAFHPAAPSTCNSDDEQHSETETMVADDGSYSSAVFHAYAACCHWCPYDDHRDDENSSSYGSFKDDFSQQTSDETCSSSSSDNYKHNNPVLTIDEKEDLQQWMKVATTRLGLERYIVGDYGTDRSLRRRQVVWTALDLAEDDEQQELQECEPQEHYATLQEAPYQNMNPSVKAELIRRACEEISRPSRLFAHAMAVANFNAQ